MGDMSSTTLDIARLFDRLRTIEPPEPDDDLINAARWYMHQKDADQDTFGRLATLAASTPGAVKTLAGLPSPSRKDLENLGISDWMSEDKRRALSAGAKAVLERKSTARTAKAAAELVERQGDFFDATTPRQAALAGLIGAPGTRKPKGGYALPETFKGTQDEYTEEIHKAQEIIHRYNEAARGGVPSEQRAAAFRMDQMRARGVDVPELPKPQPAPYELESHARRGALALRPWSTIREGAEKQYGVVLGNEQRSQMYERYEHWKSKAWIVGLAHTYAMTGETTSAVGRFAIEDDPVEVGLRDMSPEDLNLFYSSVQSFATRQDRTRRDEVIEGLGRGYVGAKKAITASVKGALAARYYDREKFGETDDPLEDYRLERRARAGLEAADPLQTLAGQTAQILPGMGAMMAAGVVGGAPGLIAAGMALETPEIIAELEDAGVDPRYARPIGVVGGLAVAFLEKLGLEQMTGTVAAAFKKEVRRGLVKSLPGFAKRVARYGGRSLKAGVLESVTEGLQAFVSSGAVSTGQWIDPSVTGPDVREAIQKAMQAGIGDFTASLGPMTIIAGALGAGGSVAGKIVVLGADIGASLEASESQHKARAAQAWDDVRAELKAGREGTLQAGGLKGTAKLGRAIAESGALLVRRGVKKFSTWATMIKKLVVDNGADPEAVEAIPEKELKQAFDKIKRTSDAMDRFGRAQRDPTGHAAIKANAEAKVIAGMMEKDIVAEDLSKTRTAIDDYIAEALPSREARRMQRKTAKAKTYKRLDTILKGVEALRVRVGADPTRLQKGPDVVMSVSEANRLSFKHEATGARTGWRAGRLNLQATQRAILQYAKRNLPGDYSRWVPLVKRIMKDGTPGQRKKLIEAIERIARKEETASAIREQKQALRDIKPNQLPERFRDAVTEYRDSVRMSQPREEVIKRYQALVLAAERDKIGEIPAVKVKKAQKTLEAAGIRRIPGTPRFLQFEELAKPLLRDLEPEDIREMTDNITQLATEGYRLQGYADPVRKRAARNERAVTEVRQWNRTAKGKMPFTRTAGRTQRERMSGTRRILTLDQQSFMTKVYRVAGQAGTVFKTLVKDMWDADNNTIARVQDLDGKLHEAMEAAGITDDMRREWSEARDPKRAKTIRISIPRGSAKAEGELLDHIEATPAEIMSFALHFRDDHQRAEIFSDRKKGIRWRNRGKTKNITTITGVAADLILSALTPQQMALVDFAWEYVNGDLRTDWNEAYKDNEGGRSINLDHGYWPHRHYKDRSADATAQQLDEWALHQLEWLSINKHRTGGEGSIAIGDFFEELYSHVYRTASYIEKTAYTRDARSMLSNGEFQNAVTESFRFSDEILEDLTEAVDEFQRLEPPASQAGDAALKEIMGKVHMGALGGKVRIMLYQTASYGLAATEISPKYLANPKVLLGKRDPTIAEINGTQKAAWLRARIEGSAHGLSSPGMARSFVGDMIRGKSRLIETLTLGPIHAADTAVMLRLWRAAKLEMQDQGVSEDQLLDATADRVRELVAKTQPTWDIATMSSLALASRQNTWKKLLTTMFSSQRNKNLNMMVWAGTEFWHLPREQKTAKAVAQLIYKLAMPSIINGMAMAVIEEASRRGVGFAVGLLFGTDGGDDEDGGWLDLIAKLIDRGVERTAGNVLVAGDVFVEVKRRYQALNRGGFYAMLYSPMDNVLANMGMEFTGAIASGIASVAAMRAEEGTVGGKEWDVLARDAADSGLDFLGLRLGIPVSGFKQLLRGAGYNIRYRKPRVNPGADVRRLFRQWNRNNPEKRLALPTLQKYFTVRGKRYRFTNTEYERLVEMAGDLIGERLKTTVEFLGSAAATQRQMARIDGIADWAAKRARVLMVREASARLRKEAKNER